MRDVDVIPAHELSNPVLKKAVPASCYAAVEEDNTVHLFDTEAEACAFQQGYRAAQGLNTLTGDEL